MRTRMKTYGFRLGALAGAALLLGAAEADAQQLPEVICEDDAPHETLRAEIDGVPRNVCPPAPSPFQLTAEGDFAGTGMRSAASHVIYWTANSGLSDSGAALQGRTLPFAVRGTQISPTSWHYQNFELQFTAAAARGDWVKNQEQAPSLQNVTGGGWTYEINSQRLGGFHQWSGHDGTFGVTHSGAQSGGGGCLNHEGGYPGWPAGFPLLAANNCPETWGSAGWQGRGWIGPIENWVDYFQDVGAEEFTFDFWRVPDQYYEDPDAVGDFQVFGMMSDHGAENRARYGSVIPGQAGDPQLEGYPIGLDVHFNAFSFEVPGVSTGFVYEGLIINNSEHVYGVPLDYDSLWFGMMIRPLRHIGGGRRANPHAIPEMGAIVHNELGRTPNCDGALTVPQSIGCSSPRNRTPGFTGGAEGHIIMKSPIGDLRNKHFTDPTSPLYAPDHPLAGDTITFNRMSMCDYRCATQQFIFDARKGYGILTANPRDILDGRDPRDISPFERWGLFRHYYDDEGNEVFCDPTTPRGIGCLGYKVPGGPNDDNPTWTYTNRPPDAPIGPDTLFIDNCRAPIPQYMDHPDVNQCTGLWADTLPSRVLNWTQNVIWPQAGPFPLEAGDTTSFVVATFAGADSAELMAALDAYYDFYVEDFYLGPGLPAPANIVQVATVAGPARNVRGTPRARISLFLDDAAASWRDPFADKFLQGLRDAAPGTFFERVAAGDPDAADKLDALLDETNVDSLYVFKSCDNGRTFTRDGSGWECDPSRAENTAGQAIGTGWQAYYILTPDDGRFPTVLTDFNVQPGHTYLYSILATTPGVHLETSYAIDEDGDGTFDTSRDTTLTIVPPGRTSLSTNAGDGFVTRVYVPATRQAGAREASVDVLEEEGPVQFASNQVGFAFLENAEAEGRFNLRFGADATVMEYRSGGAVDSTVVTLHQAVDAALPDGSVEQLDWRDVSYPSTNAAGVPLGLESDAEQSRTTMADGSTVVTTRMNAPAGVLLDQATGAPIIASSRMEPGQFTPPSLLRHPDFRDFIVELDGRPGRYVAGHWVIDFQDLRSRSDPNIEWNNGSSSSTGYQYGEYIIDWGATVFGDQLPIVDVRNPETTREHYRQNLLNRPVVSTTDVSPEVLEAVQRDIDSGITADDLIQVSLPFTVRNYSFGDPDQGAEVRVAMFADSKRETAVLGLAPDSATVDVPEDVWIPGEPLIFLEEVQLAETDADGELRVSGGELVMSSQLRVTWSQAMIACDDPRNTCNPVDGPGRAAQPGYVKVRPDGAPDYPTGWDLRVMYQNPFTSQSRFEFDVSPAQFGESVAGVTQEDLDDVRVVPNPYVVTSAYEYGANVKRLMFSNLPPSGTLRIFTASGQFVQEFSWGPEDLAGNGDLFWDLQTHEDNHIAAGLYIYIVQAEDPASGSELKKLGKFIVIR